MSMKKIIIIFLILFSFCISVSAKDKTFSLITYEKDLYYDGRYMKEENFKKTMDLVGDKTYQDTYVIENNTKKEQELFLLLESVAEDGSYNDIMEYSHLKVSLDDTIVYDGSASVMDYTASKNELYDFVSLGKFEKMSSKKLSIELVLSSDYQGKSKNKFAYVTSSFYIKNADKNFSMIEEATPQMIYNFLDVWVFCGVCVLVSILLLSIIYIRKHPLKKKEKKEDKEEEKKEDKKK